MFSCLMFSRYSAQALIDLCSDALDIKKTLVFTCCKYSRMLRSGKGTENCSNAE